MQQLEEYEVHNMEEKEQMITRDGKLATIMQQQEEDKAPKYMEKEHRGMTSTPTRKALIIVKRVLSLHHFIQYSIPQKLGVASKVTTLPIYSMLSSRIV